MKKEVVLAILNDHLVSNALTTIDDSTYGLAGFNFSNQKNYTNFILHNLIVSVCSDKEARYELSLCGLILVIAFIYHHYTSKDNLPTSNTTNTQRKSISTSKTPFILYIKVSQEEYFDKMATNYLTMLPLIFGRWNDLKEKFGSLLYDSFNFLISREARFNSMNKSIWLGGNKEFYDDLKALAEDTHVKLYPIYIGGLETMKRFEEYSTIYNSSKIASVRKKLYDIGEILKYTDIEYGLRATRNGSEHIQVSLHFNKPHVLNLGPGQAQALEEILKNEIYFLYFLNWNTIAFSKDKRVNENKTIQTIKHPFSLGSDLTIPIRDMQELVKLGSPQKRLLEVLIHDKDIREFLSRYLEDIINYRKKTLDNMSKLYRSISKSSQTPKKNNDMIEVEQIEHKSTMYTQEDTEYDIRKICSNVTL
jgi:hypothetical protein